MFLRLGWFREIAVFWLVIYAKNEIRICTGDVVWGAAIYKEVRKEMN
jgi:hypothetical protein